MCFQKNLSYFSIRHKSTDQLGIKKLLILRRKILTSQYFYIAKILLSFQGQRQIQYGKVPKSYPTPLITFAMLCKHVVKSNNAKPFAIGFNYSLIKPHKDQTLSHRSIQVWKILLNWWIWFVNYDDLIYSIADSCGIYFCCHNWMSNDMENIVVEYSLVELKSWARITL